MSELYHYGTKRHSGRYPWGSGDNPYQHSGDWLSRVETLKKKGLSQQEIIKQLNAYNKNHDYDIQSTTELRVLNAIASNQRTIDKIQTAQRLKEKEGLGSTEIARRMGESESTVRGWLDKDLQTAKQNAAFATKEFLVDRVKEKGFIDVGKGAEIAASTAQNLGVSRSKLDEALYMMELDGYKVVNIGTPQVTNPGQQTVLSVLCPKGYKTEKEAQAAAYKARNENKIATLEDISNDFYSDDGGDTFHPNKFEKPTSVDPKRVYIRYAGDPKDGGEHGELADGTVEIRRTPDLDMGKSSYAQVRILVGGTHYIKGMAINSDDIPDGYDIVVNSNKPRFDPKTGVKYSMLGEEKGTEAVLKPIKSDPNDPFGANIMGKGQSYYMDKDGKKQLSPINKIKEEGEWDSYNNSVIAAQFVSKQPVELVKRQVDLSIADKKAQYEIIQGINNPTVKRKMLIDYADACDKTASDLETVALPRQKWHVLWPCNTLKDDEVYAPNYKDGEKVALVRYPHEGTFEIPICTVNNRNREGKRKLGNSEDIIGLNAATASKLSGADFDGDTAIVIPTGGKVKIKNSYIKALEGFDPKMEYPDHPGNVHLKKSRVQFEMGQISNLITDMTIQGANEDELARATKHSMCIIDANKHKLDYKKSYTENGIAELKMKYQAHVNENGNVSTAGNTLLSRAGSKVRIDKRKGQYRINIKGNPDYDPTRPEGAKLWKTDTATYEKTTKDKDGNIVGTGKQVRRQIEVTQMELTDDARTLSRGTAKEELYAKYANACKALANEARKESVTTGRLERNPEAAKVYANEVASLNAKLNESLKNKPRERKANIMAYSIVRAKLQDNPKMEGKDLRKERNKAIEASRSEVGANGKKYRFNITDKEWEAIQAGAISDSKLEQILSAANQDRVRELSYPKQSTTKLSSAQATKIKAMSANYTQAEIAELLGLSTSTVSKYIHGKA